MFFLCRSGGAKTCVCGKESSGGEGAAEDHGARGGLQRQCQDQRPPQRGTCTCFNERWEKEERKKQAKANKQTRQSNIAHPRLTFPRKMRLRWDSNPRHSIHRTERSTSWATEAAQLAGPKSHISYNTPDMYMYIYTYMYIVHCIPVFPPPDRALYQLSYRGSTAGWAQISHLIQYTWHVHVYLHIHVYCTLYTSVSPRINKKGEGGDLAGAECEIASGGLMNVHTPCI